MKLTVLVFLYNEEKTVIQALNEAKNINVLDKEIIVVDNYSTDGSRKKLEEIKDPSIQIILQDKNYGTGKSVETGIKKAKGEFIYVHHTDLEYPPTKVKDMLNLAEKKQYDLVLGSRLANSKKTAWELIKERPENLATIITTKLINIWYGKNFTDIIGSRLYKTSSIKNIPITTYGHGFEFEHISRICKKGLKIAEIPIDYKPRANRKEKKIKPYNIINALISLFKVRYFE